MEPIRGDRWRVLIADDDPSTRLLLRRSLQRTEFDVVEAHDGDQAWELLSHGRAPELAILDWMMPGLDGLELCRRVRSLPSEGYVYIVLLSARDQKRDLLAGLHAGADDYLAKPFDRQELDARLLVGKRIVAMQAELQQAKQQLWQLATHDSLTNVWNRRGILEILQRELARTDRRPEEPVSVLLADVDHFKTINDTHGHPAGDRVLAEIASLLRQRVRSYDAIGRFGGEEFLIVLPRSGPTEARVVAERLRSTIAQASMPLGGTTPVRMSFGVASSSPRGRDTPAEILCRADEALYRAKNLGRNRVEISELGDEPEAATPASERSTAGDTPV